MPNRLAGSASPYLLAHADDPVDWWPWGEEAFAEARRRDVPVLVSIGYATCHWCHVLQRESFRSEATAALLNRGFVAVKVDREEHPEVDAHFLAEAQRLTGRLGWPLTVAVSPEGTVGFAGTYFPPEPRGGLPSFAQVLDGIAERWRADRFAAPAAAPDPAPAEGDADLDGVVDAAVEGILVREDRVYGGFGTGAKFPHAPVLGLLADRASLGDARAAEAVDRALRAIAGSALLDPVDGGAFRYATGRDWRRPHYERMLADNAQLLRLFAISGAATGDAALRTAADAIAGYLTGVLQLPEGGFATAQDSESVVAGERVEGGYHRLDAAARAAEQPPALDDKLLAGHNGLAIGALALGARLLDRPEWIAPARRAAARLRAVHRLAPGRLLRASRDGRTSPAPATLEDHGLLASGLLELALVTGEPEHAEWAIELVDATLGPDGFRAPEPDPVLAARGGGAAPRLLESALPSGPSAIAAAAWTLHLLTGEEGYADPVRALVAERAAEAAEDPLAGSALLAVLLATRTPGQQLVVIADEESPLAARARRHHRAAGIVAALPEPAARRLAAAGLDVLADRPGPERAYLCEHFVCALPIADPARLDAALALRGAAP